MMHNLLFVDNLIRYLIASVVIEQKSPEDRLYPPVTLTETC